MAKGFSIDHDRLERYRGQADAARAESRAASGRVQDAHQELRDAQDELERLERSHRGQPRIINVRDGKGNVQRRTESHHELYLDGARKRVEKAQAEMNRVAAARNDDAAARQHVTQLFSRIDAYAKGHVR